MRLERREKTKCLKDRTDDVVKGLTKLRFMPKFPTEQDQLEFIAELIARFCETQDVNDAKEPDEPEGLKHLGWFNPLDWLVKEVGSTYTFFPTPIQFRKVYDKCCVFPLDGKTAVDLENAVED
jgi:hypothetical protein